MFVPLKEPICGETICEEVDNYPAKHIELILNREADKYEELFGVDTVSIQSRINDESDDEPLCRTEETIIYPRIGRTQDDKWMFIVNYKNYVQGVRIEKCM